MGYTEFNNKWTLNGYYFRKVHYQQTSIEKIKQGTPGSSDFDIDPHKQIVVGGLFEESNTYGIAMRLPNAAPTVSQPLSNQSVDEGSTFNFTFDETTFNNVDQDTLVYAASLHGGNPLPSWLTFDSVTRTFSGTPANGDHGNYTVLVSASDPDGNMISSNFVLSVLDTAGGDDNVMDGTSSADTIYGGSAKDYISGYAGDDDILGQSEADTLKGGDGADSLEGGYGDDTLNGGSGSSYTDVFVFSDISHSTTTAADFIKFFDSATDIIDVSVLGITDSSGFSTSASGYDTLLTHGTFQVLLDGTYTVNDITFVFA